MTLLFLMRADEFRVAHPSPGDWTGIQTIPARQPNLGVSETWTLNEGDPACHHRAWRRQRTELDVKKREGVIS